MPVPTILAITRIVAEKKPISLFSSLLLSWFFNVVLALLLVFCVTLSVSLCQPVHQSIYYPDQNSIATEAVQFSKSRGATTTQIFSPGLKINEVR